MLKMSRITGFFGRLYFQFIVILAIAVLFAYVLNFIFMIDDNELRVMLSSVFLACFTGAIVLLRRI
jgi:hypothetical protein